MRRIKTLFVFLFILGLSVVVLDNFNFQKVSAASNYGKIHFINVGQSDAILLESKGKYLLVDAGNPVEHIDPTTGQRSEHYSPSTPSESVDHVIEYLNSIGVSKLDYIIATHNHLDHIGGMAKIAESGFVDSNTKYYYRKYVVTGEDTEWAFIDNKGYYTRSVNAMNKKGADLIDITDKNVNITVGNFKVKLLNTESWKNKGASTEMPNSENRNSIVEYVTIGSSKILLGADMYTGDETRLINNGSIGKIDILKPGHHGLHTSVGYDFIDVTKPETVIVTGKPNTDFKQRNNPAFRYIRKYYTTNIYFTGKVTDAIVVDFTSTSYTVKNSDNKTDISKAKMKLTGEKDGVLTKLIGENDSYYAYYVFKDNDRPRTGWYTSGSNTYYLNSNKCGAAETGVVKIDGKYYYFSAKGVLQKGFKKIDGETYYFNPKKTDTHTLGEKLTGWQNIGDGRYYFSTNSNPVGRMLVGFRLISSKLYYFTTSAESSSDAGKMVKSKTVNGIKFGSDGVATNYKGRVSKPVAISYCKNVTYNGAEQTVTKAAETGYSFSNNKKTNAGSYTVKAKLTTGYLWSNYTADDVTFSCSIAKANLSNSTITSISDKTYTGSAIKPNPVVKMTLNGSTVTLTKDTDYTVTYSNNTNLGTATVTVTGKGNFTGTKSTTFKINPDSSHLVDKPTNSYCSGAIYKGSSQTITKSAGTGYTFSNNTGTNVGSYTVTAKLKTNYRWKGNTSGDVQFTCTIGAKNISNIDISMQNQQYDGTAKTPIPVVKDGSKTLTANTDYTIGSYSNNTNVGTASLTITGKGNYTGTATGTFEIISSDTPFYIKDTTYMKLEDNRINTKLKSGINSINRTSFLNNINSSSTWIPYNKSGSEITSGTALMTTGSYIKNGNTEYRIVIYGDIDQDGLVTIKDLYQSYLLYKNKSSGLNEYQISAGDYDNNGQTNIKDLYEIYKKMREK